jgi:CHAD domain-containing protein
MIEGLNYQELIIKGVLIAAAVYIIKRQLSKLDDLPSKYVSMERFHELREDVKALRERLNGIINGR